MSSSQSYYTIKVSCNDQGFPLVIELGADSAGQLESMFDWLFDMFSDHEEFIQAKRAATSAAAAGGHSLSPRFSPAGEGQFL